MDPILSFRKTVILNVFGDYVCAEQTGRPVTISSVGSH
jgi:hypothetical protein